MASLAAPRGTADIVLALVFQTIIGVLSFFYMILTVSLFIPVLAGSVTSTRSSSIPFKVHRRPSSLLCASACP